jgi:hypothetical protein
MPPDGAIADPMAPIGRPTTVAVKDRRRPSLLVNSVDDVARVT